VVERGVGRNQIWWWWWGEGIRFVEFQFAFALREYSIATSEFESVGV